MGNSRAINYLNGDEMFTELNEFVPNSTIKGTEASNKGVQIILQTSKSKHK